MNKRNLICKMSSIILAIAIIFANVPVFSYASNIDYSKKYVETYDQFNLNEFDFILAVGGGSVIDTAKSISVSYQSGNDPWEYNIHKKVAKKSIPIGVILTISAAGSEMSNSCVISSLETNDQGYIVAAVGAYTDEIPYTAYFAKKSFIENNSDVIERFTRAIYKGQQWVNEHTPTEIAEAVLTSFPDSDIVLLEKSIANYKSIDAWNTDPYMTKESFDKLQEVMTLAGELEKYAPYEAIVNNTFAEKVR